MYGPSRYVLSLPDVPSGRYVLCVDDGSHKRGAATGYVRGFLAVVLHAITEGFSPLESKTSLNVLDSETGDVVASSDWGRDTAGAEAARQSLQADLDRLGLVDFCQEFNFELHPPAT